MNTLETFLTERREDEVAMMNALQDHGVISDNCVMAADVADRDCAAAIAFLKQL